MYIAIIFHDYCCLRAIYIKIVLQRWCEEPLNGVGNDVEGFRYDEEGHFATLQGSIARQSGREMKINSIWLLLVYSRV